ncbi:MAG: nicotinate (nicotinamide) nucleotide adenylyltransferase [Pseudomonadales bacterium]
MTQRIGILGGSFDPVHRGHIESAKALLEKLQLDRLLLVPVAQHAFGKKPLASGEHRLNMLEIGIADIPGLSVDDIELQRSGPSYSVDTLAHYRARFGERAVLCFVIGSDVLPALPRWHHWRRLPVLANFVVIKRAKDVGFAVSGKQQAQDSAAQRGIKPVDDIKAIDGSEAIEDIAALFETVQDKIDKPAGQLLRVELPAMPFSSTSLRTFLQSMELQSTDFQSKTLQGKKSSRRSRNTSQLPAGEHVHTTASAGEYLAEALPAAVLEYIESHGLYTANPTQQA